MQMFQKNENKENEGKENQLFLERNESHCDLFH